MNRPGIKQFIKLYRQHQQYINLIFSYTQHDFNIALIMKFRTNYHFSHTTVSNFSFFAFIFVMQLAALTVAVID